ncbi:MAG: CARDB domain-containing protein, partial [Leptolyngbyaceae cyanobacterium]
SASRAYGYVLEVSGKKTLLRRESDGNLIGRIERRTNLSLLAEDGQFSFLGMPDLVIETPSVPASVTLGQEVSISADIKNIGDGPATSSSIGYWLSDDTILDQGDRSLSDGNVSELNAGASGRNTYTFTYDASWGTGSKYILFEADGSQEISEQNESNNVAAVQVSVVEKNVIHGNENVIHGDQENNRSLKGTHEADKIYGYGGNDRLFGLDGDDYLDAYGGGDTANGGDRSREQDILVGGAGADQFILGNSNQTYYANNGGRDRDYAIIKDFNPDSDTIQLQKLSDHVDSASRAYGYVLEVSGKKTLLRRESDGNLIGRIERRTNLSLLAGDGQFSFLGISAPSTTSVPVSPPVNEVVLPPANVPIAPPTNVPVSPPANVPVSPSVNEAVLPQSNEATLPPANVTVSLPANEVALPPTTVPALQADLEIQNVAAPTSVALGNAVNISAEVKNVGDGAADSSSLRYWLSDDATLGDSDRLLVTDAVSMLAVGSASAQSHVFTYDASWGIGSKYILIEADGDNHIGESNETNNVATTALTVRPQAQVVAKSNVSTMHQDFDADNVFALHSNPDADHTIYLDFDGHTTEGTRWNWRYNRGQSFETPAYDTDGDSSSFSLAERETIWEIWHRVAEDFIPFDVNVTTAEPIDSDLVKSGDDDQRWGIRTVIGGKSNDWLKIKKAAGIAYLDSFNEDTDTPTFVFQNNRNLKAKNLAEVATHEIGHTLGLRHDGNSHKKGTKGEYYMGHGSGTTGWAAIMGYASKHELTQWSQGDYHGANNQEDDLAIITTKNGFGYRVDDYGNTMSSAASLLLDGTNGGTYGIIEKNTDEDWFSFTSSTGNISLDIDPSKYGPNLDIMAELYDASGQLLVTSNPFDELSAGLEGNYTAGQYYLRILGTGKEGKNGYSDYGSLGQYSITGSIA